MACSAVFPVFILIGLVVLILAVTYFVNSTSIPESSKVDFLPECKDQKNEGVVTLLSHGLGNRLRVLSSAGVFSEYLKIPNILVWTFKDMTDTNVEDLFEKIPDAQLLDYPPCQIPYYNRLYQFPYEYSLEDKKKVKFF